MAVDALDEAARPRPGGDRRRWPRWRRVLAGATLLAIAVLVVGLIGGGIHYSNQLVRYPEADPPPIAAQVRELTARGLAVERVEARGPLGTYPGVLVPGSSDTWVLVVHGRGAAAVQAVPLAPALADDDRPVLYTTFRNDGFAPDDPDGYATFGHREWRDLQAWVDTAQAAGADSIVLFGLSLGGSITASFLQASPDADVVDAVVLDSPVLSLHETLELQAEGVGIPAPLTPPLLAATKAISSLRTGMDFAALEHVARWDDGLPALLVHDPDDTTVPDDPTVELADDLGDRAELVQPAGVGHVGWAGADGAAYRDRVRSFLDDVGGR
jgi:pimeloyl-ACP methyl ester carboxylesterase